MNKELKHCLFCGDRNSQTVFNGVAYINSDRKIVYGVRCDNCGYVKLSFISEKDAINEWNKEVTE